MIKTISKIILIPSIIVYTLQVLAQLGVVAYPAPVTFALSAAAWIIRTLGIVLGIAGW